MTACTFKEQSYANIETEKLQNGKNESRETGYQEKGNWGSEYPRLFVLFFMRVTKQKDLGGWVVLKSVFLN